MNIQQGIQQATRLQQQGQFQAAADLFNQLLSTFGAVPELVWEIARFMLHIRQHQEAIKFATLLTQPQAPLAFRVRGYQLLTAIHDACYQPDKALEAAKQAFKLAPDQASNAINLVAMHEKLGDTREVETLTPEAIERFGHQPGLVLPLARVYRRQKRLADALAILEKLRPETRLDLPSAIYFELGQVTEQLSRHSEALQWFTQANNRQAQEFGIRDNRTFIQQLKKQLAQLETIPPTPVQVCDDHDPATPFAQQAFLLGFPRTGTTLVEQMLDAHPDIIALEERPLLTRILASLTPEEQARYPASVFTMDTQRLSQLRALYWQAVTEHVPADAGKTFVDKQPINSIHAVLLYHLFPRAHFIYCTRHPVDTCLSCFKQQFDLNPAMQSFLDLNTTIETWKTVFSIWQASLQRCQLQPRIIRYEDLISDMRETLQQVLDKLQLPWNEAIENFHQHALKRRSVSTASYAQVSQPLYSSSVNLWRHYAPMLEDQITPLKEACQQLEYDL